MGDQRKGDCQELFVGAHLSSKGSHHYPSMPQACLQNSISPVCGGGSPLADTLGTSQVLSSGLASQPDKQGVGGKGSKDVPPAWLLGQKGLTPGLLSTRKSPLWVLPVCPAEKDQHCHL